MGNKYTRNQLIPFYLALGFGEESVFYKAFRRWNNMLKFFFPYVIVMTITNGSEMCRECRRKLSSI